MREVLERHAAAGDDRIVVSASIRTTRASRSWARLRARLIEVKVLPSPGRALVTRMTRSRLPPSCIMAWARSGRLTTRISSASRARSPRGSIRPCARRCERLIRSSPLRVLPASFGLPASLCLSLRPFVPAAGVPVGGALRAGDFAGAGFAVAAFLAAALSALAAVRSAAALSTSALSMAAFSAAAFFTALRVADFCLTPAPRTAVSRWPASSACSARLRRGTTLCTVLMLAKPPGGWTCRHFSAVRPSVFVRRERGCRKRETEGRSPE